MPMKKAEQLAMLMEIPENARTAKVRSAIEMLQTTRGIAFEEVKLDSKLEESLKKALSTEYWYTIINDKLVRVPVSKKRNDGRTAEFVPYYRTVANV